MHDQLTHQLSADRTSRACCRAISAARDLITRTIALVPRLERQIDAIRQTLMAKQKFIS